MELGRLSTPLLWYQKMCQPALRKAGRGQSEKIQASPEQEPVLPAAQSWGQLPQPQQRALLSPSKHRAATKGIRQRGNQELSQDCHTSKGSWSFCRPTPTPVPVSAVVLACTHRSGAARTSPLPHRSCRSSSLGEEVLPQPWEPESCSAPTASCHHSSSASCLTMNLTALTEEESSQHPIPTMQR